MTGRAASPPSVLLWHASGRTAHRVIGPWCRDRSPGVAPPRTRRPRTLPATAQNARVAMVRRNRVDTEACGSSRTSITAAMAVTDGVRGRTSPRRRRGLGDRRRAAQQSHGRGCRERDDDREVQEDDRPEECPSVAELRCDGLPSDRAAEGRQVAHQNERREPHQHQTQPATLLVADGRHGLTLCFRPRHQGQPRRKGRRSRRGTGPPGVRAVLGARHVLDNMSAAWSSAPTPAGERADPDAEPGRQPSQSTGRPGPASRPRGPAAVRHRRRDRVVPHRGAGAEQAASANIPARATSNHPNEATSSSRHTQPPRDGPVMRPWHAGGHHGNGSAHVLEHRLRDRAGQEPTNRAALVGPHDDQVGVAAEVDQPLLRQQARQCSTVTPSSG